MNDQDLVLVLSRIAKGIHGQDPNDLMNIHTRLVLGEFMRLYFDSRFERWPCPKNLKRLIGLEANLWGETLKMLERMSTLGRLSEPVPLIFHLLFLERQFICFYAYGGNENQGKKIVANLQSQNRQLQILEHNPFKNGTRQIFDEAMDLAETSDRFRSNIYMPTIRARMTLTTHFKDEGYRLYRDDKPLTRQGEHGKKSKRPKPLPHKGFENKFPFA